MDLKAGQPTKKESCEHSLTCFGIDGKKILGIPTCNPVCQFLIGTGVGILSLDLNDRYILWRVFHDNRIINRFRGQGGIVIHIFNFNVDLNSGIKWNNAPVCGIHGQPVGPSCLSVKNVCSGDDS